MIKNKFYSEGNDQDELTEGFVVAGDIYDLEPTEKFGIGAGLIGHSELLGNNLDNLKELDLEKLNGSLYHFSKTDLFFALFPEIKKEFDYVINEEQQFLNPTKKDNLIQYPELGAFLTDLYDSRIKRYRPLDTSEPKVKLDY